ncbi:DUF4232 domain-containing protein [Pseudonocardia sediminis]|nr:DUF4232 domain-containing protein [Pseudonocardia sediminis]
MTARLTLAAVAAATLALAGCSSGEDWPTTAGAASSAPTTTAAAPTTDTPASNTAAGDSSGGGAEGSGSGASGGGAAGGGNSARCTTAELTGSLGPADGAAGSVNQTLILTNSGSRTCYLRGFPGVSYVGGDNGAQVGPSAVMDGPRGGDLRLGPGGSVGAAMKLANVANFDTASCRPVPVRGLRIYPPGDTASLFVPREGTGCSGTPSSGNQLAVRSLEAR